MSMTYVMRGGTAAARMHLQSNILRRLAKGEQGGVGSQKKFFQKLFKLYFLKIFYETR